MFGQLMHHARERPTQDAPAKMTAARTAPSATMWSRPSEKQLRLHRAVATCRSMRTS